MLDKIFCYYGSWAAYGTGNAKVTVEDIDANRCSHLTYAFIGLNEDGTVRVLDQWNDVDNGNFIFFFETIS